MEPKSDASMFWRGLKENLFAGTRLALFVPVRPLDFRISAAQCAALILAGLGLWLAMGVLRQGLPGSVDYGALTAALAGIPVLLGACLLAARLFGEARLAPAFAVVLVASDPAVLIVEYLVELVSDIAALPVNSAILDWVFLAWTFAIVVRTQYVLTGWRGRRSALVLLLLAALFAVLFAMAPRGELWVAAGNDDEDAAGERLTQEEVFHRQGMLLDERLAALAPERSGVADLYFVGVAADAGQDTFYSEIVSVKELLDERFDTEGRSIVLVNNPATLTEYPIATASNLRATLAHLGNTIDAEEDVVLLHITTHGSSDYRLAFDLPPLELAQLTPSALARMLADSGIKWKVIVISACFSGGFIEPLKDDNTLVITAADAFHSSFGCAYDSDYTWFSEAFYDEALRTTFSFAQAFAAAKKTVGERERAEGYAPSNPQIAMGGAMRQKLAGLEKRLAADSAKDAQKSRAIRVRASDSRMVLVKGR
jgi:peptidase C13-like protein